MMMMIIIIIILTVFPRDIVCLRNISINTLHKGDDDDDNNNDNDNNNNNDNDIDDCRCHIKSIMFNVIKIVSIT